MPKRLVDGDAIASSEKLLKVREEFRVHYPYLLTLALGNGSFECSAAIIWRQLYAILMPSMTLEKVSQMLDEFEQARMLFRWTVKGKVWGHWVGQLKGARLPAPSKTEHYKMGAAIPMAELAVFAGEDIVSTQPEQGAPKSANGIGTGIGNGIGTGLVNGSVTGTAAEQPASTVTIDSTTSHSHSPTTTTNDDNDQRQDSAFGDDPESELEEPKAKVSTSVKEREKAESIAFFTRFLYILLSENPSCTLIPPNYADLWFKDFESMLESVDGDPKPVFNVILLSQIPKNQKFYVRAQSIKDKFDHLLGELEMKHNRKAVNALREFLKKKFGVEKLSDLLKQIPQED
jgi:hypothetical protein